MNINNYLQTSSCFVYPDFYRQIACNPNIFTVVEVGVWKGHSIIFLVQEMIKCDKQNIKAFAVDSWAPEHPTYDKFEEKPIIYDIFKKNVKIANLQQYITDIRCNSWDGAQHFEDNSLDFVFIDADHRYEYVKKDILAYLPKVKTGGIIAGHDYFTIEDERDEIPDVKSAVDELISTGILHNLTLHGGNVWCTIKE